MPIKSFRGKMEDGAMATIHLHTNDGSIGYKIVKFELLGPDGNTNSEQVVQVFKVEQTTASTEIDFSDNTLLAAGIYNFHNNTAEGVVEHVLFDNEIFNQDIYITNKGHDNTSAMNYYIELEQIKLDLNENTVATLKDIRNETLTV